jgi:hypothetical protein
MLNIRLKVFLVDISKFLIESSTFRSNVNGIWVDILRQYKLWISSGEINTEFQIFLNFSPEKWLCISRVLFRIYTYDATKRIRNFQLNLSGKAFVFFSNRNQHEFDHTRRIRNFHWNFRRLFQLSRECKR